MCDICHCDYDCSCDCESSEDELVCFEQCSFNNICLENLCRVTCINSYVTDTKIMHFCKKPVLKICYAVDILYITEDCEEKQHTIYGTSVFMCTPEDFELCNMRATTHSVVCENHCCNNVKIKTIVKVCG